MVRWWCLVIAFVCGVLADGLLLLTFLFPEGALEEVTYVGAAEV
jgi:hypothetical protein